MFKIIETKNAPSAIGPYSQAIIVDNFIFCSGQIGIKPKTNQLVEGIEKQTKQALKNLEAILAEDNSTLKNIIKTTIYLKNIADFPKINKVYAEFFGEHKPARTTIEISNLPKRALIKIEAIAIKS